MSSNLEELIANLDKAVEIQETTGCCHQVKKVLEETVRAGVDLFSEDVMRPAEGRYARRLIHKDRLDRYTVMVMVWDVNQGTALHDHAHMWCVECVYRGRIQVTSYSLQNNEEDPLLQFEHETEIYADPGDAGALIPPFEYHILKNALTDKPSVTIHVYGGEMKWSNAFIPVEGGYKREKRELSYTP